MTQKNFKVKNGLTVGEDTVTVDATTGDLVTAGTIKNTGKNIYAGSNRTYTGGDTTDILRLRSPVGSDAYTAYTGVLASNADKTTTLGARPAVVIRGYGQNVSGGTTTTPANPGLHMESTRGTPTTPYALGSNEALGVINAYSNAGTTAGTPYWLSENYAVSPSQIVLASSQAHSATPSASATFTANFTAATSMVVTAVSSGTIGFGHEMRYNSGGTGSFSNTNTYSILYQNSSSSAAAATTTATTIYYPTSKITVASATGIVVGQLVVGTGIPAGALVSAINGTTITLAYPTNSYSGAPALTTAQLSTTTVNFYTTGGAGTYTLNASPYSGTSNSVNASTYATTLGTVVLTRAQPANAALTNTSRPTVASYASTIVSWQAQAATGSSHFTWNTWASTVSGGTNRTLMYVGPNASGVNSDRYVIASYANGGNQFSFVGPENSGDGNTYLGLNNRSMNPSGNSFPVFNFTNQRTVDNVNYTPTKNNDIIGQYKFNGNAYTSTTPSVPAGPAAQISCFAAEDWDATKNGAGFAFTCIKKGTTTDHIAISATSENLSLSGDAVTFRDSSSNNLLSVDANRLQTYKPVRYTITDAGNFSGGSTYTPSSTVNNAIKATVNAGTGGFNIALTNLIGDNATGGHYQIAVVNTSGSSQSITTSGGVVNINHNLADGSSMMITVYVVGTLAFCEHIV